MITANVKDAGAAALVNLAPGPSGKVQASGGADSFQNVLNKQTDTPDTAKKAGSGKKPAAEKTPDEGQRIPRRERAKDVRQEKESPDPAEETEALSEETVDAVKEAAAQLLMQMADAFGTTVEELRGLMQEMGVTDADLLTEQGLGGLILEAAGAEGSFELVTDGELYEKFRSLMEDRRQLTEEIASGSGMQPEELLRKLTEGTRAVSVPEDLGAEETLRDSAAQDPADAGAAEADPLTEVLDRDAPKTEDRGGDSDRQDHGREAGRGETGEFPGGMGNGPLMRTEDPGTAVFETRTESASQAMGTDTRDIMRQILDYMKVQIRPETTSLEMQLHPANLGTLQIQLASKGGAVTAQFIAENEAVKAALENQMIQLRENFEEQGIRVEAIEVSVQTGRFEQSYEEQERGGEEQQTSRGRSGRRLRLDAQTALEQTESLTDEERLAADMMAVNGGTVDYMA